MRKMGIRDSEGGNDTNNNKLAVLKKMGKRNMKLVYGLKQKALTEFYSARGSRQFFGEAFYKAYYEELVQNELEWMEFFKHDWLLKSTPCDVFEPLQLGTIYALHFYCDYILTSNTEKTMFVLGGRRQLYSIMNSFFRNKCSFYPALIETIETHVLFGSRRDQNNRNKCCFDHAVLEIPFHVINTWM